MNDVAQVGGLERAIDDAERLFVDAGRAKADASRLDRKRKRVRSALLIKHRANVKSVAEAEALAESDPVYEAICIELDEAELQFEVLEARAEAKRLRFDAWRTVNATERAKMNLR